MAESCSRKVYGDAETADGWEVSRRILLDISRRIFLDISRQRRLFTIFCNDICDVLKLGMVM